MRTKNALWLPALLFVLAGPARAGDAVPDPQMKGVLDQLAKLDPRPIETLSPDEARKQPTAADAVRALLEEQGRSTRPEPVSGTENRKLEGPGGEIRVRIYWPEGDGPFPVVVYYHGGGWVLADLDVYDASARAIANAATAMVISADYRRAPEHKFPAAHEDALAAYRWALANAEELNGDPTRVAVAGESAGGNLAAAVAMAAKQQRLQLPVHQLLIYPIADYGFDTPSYAAYADARPLSRPMMKWFFANYLNRPAEGDSDQISLADAVDLEGLPSATIITAEIDPLRSEGERFAERLRSAGVRVDYRNYLGVTHEFFGMAAAVDKAKQAVAQAGAGLDQAFAEAVPVKIAAPGRR